MYFPFALLHSLPVKKKSLQVKTFKDEILLLMCILNIDLVPTGFC